jgi:predicted aminopeptidase
VVVARRLAALSTVAAAAACVLVVSGCASVGYLAKQGCGLFRYSTGTRAARSVLEDPGTDPQTRELILRTQEIRRFAVDAIGLANNRSYTRYKRVDRDHLVDVVQACDAASFTPYLWRYPVLGKLPYRGYYERPDADAEAARLEREGYDVVVREVDAFSTLGFTRDPLYSFLSRYSAFDLASTILHEQTHATVFAKGRTEFNEALATFVGEQGAFEWLEQRFGGDSAEYRAAVEGKADADTLSAMLHGLSVDLEEVYASGRPREEKLAEKARIIAAFRETLSLEKSTRFRTEAYRRIGTIRIDNAVLSMYRLYSDGVPALRAYWRDRCGSDLRRLVEAAKSLGARMLD